MSEKLISQYDETIPAETDYVLIDDGSGFYEKSQTGNLPGGGGGVGSDTVNPSGVTAILIAPDKIQVAFNEAMSLTSAGFGFTLGGTAWAISSLSGSGTIWEFTMSSIATGAEILLSYNRTTGNSLDAAGNELNTITALKVVQPASSNVTGNITLP
jgi:hypothetical protein